MLCLHRQAIRESANPFSLDSLLEVDYSKLRQSV